MGYIKTRKPTKLKGNGRTHQVQSVHHDEDDLDDLSARSELRGRHLSYLIMVRYKDTEVRLGEETKYYVSYIRSVHKLHNTSIKARAFTQNRYEKNYCIQQL